MLQTDIPKDNSPRYTVSPTPRVESTIFIIVALVLGWVFEPTDSPYSIASHYARILASGLILGFLFELKTMGFGRIIRTDWICLAIFYALSYLEFLFDQPELNQISTIEQTRAASHLFNLGILSISISRHLWPAKRVRVSEADNKVISSKVLLLAYWASFFLGYFHIFISVNFDFPRVIEEMMRPRFSQPWGRGRLGDWKALLVELGLLIYLIPPIYGTLLALRKKIPAIVIITATPVFLLTIFFGFSTGTRNIFGTFAITFLVAYLINLRSHQWLRIGVFTTVILSITAYGSYHMLEFRNMGLKRYIEGDRFTSSEGRESVFIDFNLKYVGDVYEAFPDNYDFLGFEVPFWALVKPIPRAIWSGKPEGLSVSIEEATNVEQMSVATTWVGESYMAFGHAGVIASGCFIGLMCGFWNRRGSKYASPLEKIIYASGFFAAALTMRSGVWFTTAILPTIAIILGSFLYSNFLPKASRKRKRRETANLPLDSL